ncbi:chromosomal replication initiator protein DnaA [Acidaminococcus fermentans]|uniref:chromosomal replication initiator protein DnaA n=1 Tax=Acidaminococcus fermentans TaxID=905 RepID=UPI00241FBC75|nr:chromosomal replication initiator protein DnaA [Acidaminococcus fermentans]MCF0140356.1 chromosomal replication initiator protein DnaA [Acidaminococcus fermentans]MDY2852396.1 chromosomal replication initiator protein DnaA [Acidaminococcus fermentans]MDY4147522.1 chromosomal replication initiator protein DnaA [Acidaminococcus fermentans]MEE0339122.1 chromosomal replication initiator protein DnaA [Acidaminococcus fermentans]
MARKKMVELDLFAEQEPAPEPEKTAPAAPPEKKSPASLPQKPFVTNLSPRYTFDNFVVGNSNRFAKAAAMAVANNPAFAYNPFFLFSDSGLGKTHLMNAIGNQIRKNHPDMKILYISSETFTNELIESVEHNRLEAFREKYRSIDVLLIDDIQFLRNRESTQEEFFHTFNTLEKANKQIIISSDRPPAELDTLEERMISRFNSGLTADIQHPDLETRMAILQNLAHTDKVPFPNDVILLIASSITSNIRELEGAYNRVCAYSTVSKEPITLELCRSALKELNLLDTPQFVTVDAIQQQVADHFRLHRAELIEKKRTRRVAVPRMIAIYLTKEMAGLSLKKIGECFGGRDHSTIIHACEKIQKDRQEDPELNREIDALILELKNRKP